MDKITAKKIGQRINRILAEKDMLQKELAEMLNISANTVSYFAKGDRMPNTKQIIDISKSLDISADYILGISDVSSSDETAKSINKALGLSEHTINRLKEEKACGNNEIASFIDRLVSCSDFVRFIKLIDTANKFFENPQTMYADENDAVGSADMFLIYKTHINDMFWGMLEGYHINDIGEEDKVRT